MNIRDKHEHSLDRWLGSKRKYLKKDQYRKATSNNGLARGHRGVVSEHLEEVVVASDSGDSSPMDAGENVRKLNLIRLFLREYEKNARRLELIERCVIHGEPPNKIAAEYGLTPENASSIVSRARKWLGIRIRKASKQPRKTRQRRNSPA